MVLRRPLARVLAVGALVTAAFGVQTALTAGPSAPSAIVTVEPARILDTRTPLGVPAKAPVGPNSTITLQVTGVGGVPANATGVVLTLTAVDATLPTFITATPTGTTRSSTSVLNPNDAGAIANTITVALGTNGRIDLYNLTGNVNLIADVSGYLLPADATGQVVTRSIDLTAYGATTRNAGAADSFGCIDLANTGELFLQVPLDHGAAVQSVTFRWYDDDAANMTMYVSEIDGGGFTALTAGNLVNGQTASTGSSGFGSSTVNITGGDRVSSNVRYVIGAFTLGQLAVNTTHRFCGATVTYLQIL